MEISSACWWRPDACQGCTIMPRVASLVGVRWRTGKAWDLLGFIPSGQLVMVPMMGARRVGEVRLAPERGESPLGGEVLRLVACCESLTLNITPSHPRMAECAGSWDECGVPVHVKCLRGQR